MDRYCKEIWVELVDFAEGKPSAKVQAHLDGCASCRKELKVVKRTLSALKVPHYEPPLAVLRSATAIVPQPVWARMSVKSSSLGLVGARGATDFQVIFEEGPVWARLFYQRMPGGWNVSGRVSTVKSVEAFVGSKALDLDEEGRFTFTVAELSETGVGLVVGGDHVLIPAASEIQSGESAADR